MTVEWSKYAQSLTKRLMKGMLTGPGVYDIHSPRCPSVEEIVVLSEKAAERLPANRIWVNPDCGLKIRKWDEVRPATRQHGRSSRKN